VLQERVYQQLVQDVDELKLHLIDSWSSTDIQQAIIDQATDQCRVRLRACIPETGRNLEHLLQCFGIALFVHALRYDVLFKRS